MNLPKPLRDYFFLVFLSALTAALLPATGAWAGSKVFDLVTLGNDGSLPQDGLYSGDNSRITPDGRFVVYRSGETKLVTPKTSGYQIFLRDRRNGTTELISTSDAGQYGNGSSESATISDDGCRVVFISYSTNLVTGYQSRPNNSNVYLRDRCTTPNTTTLVSVNYSGAQSNAASYAPAISGNGRFVAFNSYSTDLVQGVADTDVLYRRDLDTQTTILLSANIVDGKGEQANYPSLSFDGSRIAFSSASTKLVSATVFGWNVFLYDANSNPHIRLVSSDANGNPQNLANGDWTHPGISEDGHYVSFYSNAPNLVPNDTNNEYDVFVKNVDTKEIWRASESSSGKQSNGITKFNSTLSKDGTWVTFYTEATNLVDNLTIGRVVLLHNIHTGETRLVSASNSYTESAPNISGDLYGRFVSNFWGENLDASLPHAGVFVYDRHRLPVAIAKIDASTVQPAKTGDLITLDGSSSNNNANLNYTPNFFAPKAVPALIFTWTQTEGNSVTFNDPHAAKPTFTAPAEGTYTFKLVVGDTVEDSAASTVSIQVGSGSGPGPVNQKPIANAGPDQTGALVAQLVQLNGSLSSDPDSGPNALSYSWSQLSGQSLTLTNANTATPSFTPTLPGTYSFRLVVNDGKDLSTPDVVTVTVGTNTASNVPPVAEAGNDQIVTKGDVVTLDGSQSFDPDDDTAQLSYVWKQVGGPQVKLDDTTLETPSFNAAKVGSYSFQLIVKDNNFPPAASLPSVVTVTVESGSTSGNEPPLALADVTPGQKIVGTAVKLNGAGSNDPDQAPKKKLKYQWVQIDGPAVKLLSATSAAPQFTPKQPGDYVFELTVFDGEDWSAPDSVTVNIAGDIAVTLPLEGDVWELGSTQTINYETADINPKTPLQAYAIWINGDGEYDFVALKKVKAKTLGTLSWRIPNKPRFQTEFAVILLCANEDFCGNSGVFSIQ
ncbi:MAG: PKD domain-containing protein [Methylococcales bacterium]|nr:hypothetical protein [Methylococcaceae bacterium]